MAGAGGPGARPGGGAAGVTSESTSESESVPRADKTKQHRVSHSSHGPGPCGSPLQVTTGIRHRDPANTHWHPYVPDRDLPSPLHSTSPGAHSTPPLTYSFACCAPLGSRCLLGDCMQCLPARTNPSMTGSSRARPGDRPCIPYVGRTDGGVPAGAGARPGPGPAAGYESPCVSLFYVNDIGSTGSRGRTRGIPCVYPSP